GITVWQVPNNVYRMVSVSYAELDAKVAGAGPLGEYLVRQLKEFNAAHHPVPIESRSLGDSPAISLMLYPHSGNFRVRPAPRFGAEGHHIPGSGHPIMVCESIDTRFLLEDMFAKINKFAAETSRN
ncbi:MAG TPA: nucleoside hydrolase, partial [Microlunatus sp.]|nr:nucleoside hydrolase [Microlunatus sp.]